MITTGAPTERAIFLATSFMIVGCLENINGYCERKRGSFQVGLFEFEMFPTLEGSTVTSMTELFLYVPVCRTIRVMMMRAHLVEKLNLGREEFLPYVSQPSTNRRKRLI
jgi:hypothetical protein